MSDPKRSERRRAILRIALGQAQMIGAVVSFLLLLQTGMSGLTVVAFAFTCACLVASRLLFSGQEG